MEFIDSHAHLYLEDFADDLDQVVKRAQEVGVSQVLLPNIDCSTLPSLIHTSQCYPLFFKPMIGLHPTSVGEDYAQELAHLELELAKPSVDYIAIGEIGLDLYWDKTYKEQQVEAFKTQLRWSIKYKLPVVIHSREAYGLLESILSDQEFKQAYGVIHSFTGSESDLDLFLPLDKWYIGINGIVTFKNSQLSTYLKKIPIDRLLIETDSPYLTPEPYRGRRNESKYLLYTLQKLAEIYQISPTEMAQYTKKNTLKLFRI